ncbi:MAG: hypothetical protein MHM6MM_006966 [Cercozoa sp. M6MM]
MVQLPARAVSPNLEAPAEALTARASISVSPSRHVQSIPKPELVTLGMLLRTPESLIPSADNIQFTTVVCMALMACCLLIRSRCCGARRTYSLDDSAEGSAARFSVSKKSSKPVIEQRSSLALSDSAVLPRRRYFQREAHDTEAEFGFESVANLRDREASLLRQALFLTSPEVKQRRQRRRSSHVLACAKVLCIGDWLCDTKRLASSHRGSVFRCYHRHTGICAVMKMINFTRDGYAGLSHTLQNAPSHIDPHLARRDFDAEIEFLLSDVSRHKNLVSMLCYDKDVDGGAIWLKIASYGSLRTVSHRWGALSSPQPWLEVPSSDSAVHHRIALLRHVAAEIADALRYMHSQGWTHCDVKLDNILVTEDMNVLLADFGQSVQTHKLPGSAARDGHMVDRVSFGTWYARAPEVAALAQRYERDEDLQMSARLDVWSYGIVVHQLAAHGHAVPDFLATVLHQHADVIHERKGSLHTSEGALTRMHALLCQLASADPDEEPESTQEFRSFFSRCFQCSPWNRASMHEIRWHPALEMDEEARIDIEEESSPSQTLTFSRKSSTSNDSLTTFLHSD